MSTIEQFGRFNDQEGTFELTAEPPRKWRNTHYNQVGDMELYSEISNIGDGFTRVREADGTTIQLVGWDCRYVYIRDDADNTTFCPWGAPAPQEVTDRIATFSAAKTEIAGTAKGLRGTFRYFIPRTELFECWTVTVQNLTDKPRKVSVFGYAMFQLTGNDGEGRGIWKDNYADVLPEIGGVLVVNRSMDCPNDRFKGYLIALNDFRAGNSYRDQFTRSEFSLGTPKILWGYNCDNQGAYGPDCAGVVQISFEIPPHSTKRADLLLGNCSGVEDVKKIRARVTVAQIDKWCDEQVRIEKERAGKFTVDLGKANANRSSLMNHFVKKQMYSYLIDKSGFRDNLQMDCAIALFDYPTAEDNLLKALCAQKPDGSALHSFRPLNRHQYSDKPAWILQTVPWLIKESGNFDLLKQTVPYFESSDKGTVWDHVKRAYRFLCRDLGKHGLCDQHFADWNDGLEPSPDTGARESVMVSQQLCFGLLEVAELADLIGDKDVAAEARREYATMKDKINTVAWDPEGWYLRTLCEHGPALGSSELDQGRIFINTQSWAILSRIADGDRAARCMAAVDKFCTKPVGYVICDPPMYKYDPRIGKFSRTMPFHAENGGCYCHAAGFKGVADCVLGRAEEAWQTFVRVAPDNPDNPIPQSKLEPFSFTNMYDLVKQIYGQSGYPWRTGTAGWFTQLLIEWILGARRGYKGLVISPCLSKTIPQAKIKRTFRGAVYDIALDNTAGRCVGTKKITVDGKAIEGNVLPVFKDGMHKVEVVI